MHHNIVHHDYHLHHYFQNREINELYFTIALKSFANSMVGIFIPAYLWNLGFSIRNIALYYIIYFFFVFALAPFCFKAAEKWGIKHNITAGLLISVLYFYLLYQAQNGFPIWIVAFVGSIYVAYYATGFHLDFARFTEKGNTGKELALIRFLANIARLGGPIIGALILTKFSFPVLIFIVGFFIVISVIPMLISEEKHFGYKFRFGDLWKERNTKYIMSFEASGIIGAVSEFAWPLFIFISLQTYISLGAIVTLTAILVSFFILFIGRLSDTKFLTKVLSAGSSFHSIVWIVRYFIVSGLGIFFVNIASSASYVMFDLPWNKLVYHKAIAQKNKVQFFIMREMGIMIGRMIVLGFIFVTENLFSGFIIAAFASLLFLMFRNGGK
jgi:MFS family permease